MLGVGGREAWWGAGAWQARDTGWLGLALALWLKMWDREGRPYELELREHQAPELEGFWRLWKLLRDVEFPDTHTQRWGQLPGCWDSSEQPPNPSSLVCLRGPVLWTSTLPHAFGIETSVGFKGFLFEWTLLSPSFKGHQIHSCLTALKNHLDPLSTPWNHLPHSNEALTQSRVQARERLFYLPETGAWMGVPTPGWAVSVLWKAVWQLFNS